MAASARSVPHDAWKVWRHKWSVLGWVGLTEERWHSLSLVKRRAVIAAAVGLLLLIVIGPFSGIDDAAVITYAIFVALYVPSWHRLGRVGRWVIPVAFFAIAVTFPYYTDRMFTIPILGAFPDTHTAVASPGALSPTVRLPLKAAAPAPLSSSSVPWLTWVRPV